MAVTQIIRGFPFPKVMSFTAKNIEDTLDYIPHDGDVIIASYPKTGTTWLQYIVFQITSKGEMFPSFDDCTYKYAPFLELAGTAILENMEEPRVYKYHCPYNMVQKNNKAKYIYIYRKPEDTVISYYHFSKFLGGDPLELDQFFEDFLSGSIAYGSYFDHVLSYLTHKDDENLLLVSYEKLSLNRREEILRIAKFLGDEYFQMLSENDSIMDKVLEHTSFDYMKANLSLVRPGAKDGDGKVDFFRKGIVGDGKKTLNPEQLKRIKDVAMERLEGHDLLTEWFDE